MSSLPPSPINPPTRSPNNLPGNNPLSWFLHSWRHYADFSGRARRREWWSFWFINCIPYVLFTLLSSPLDKIPQDEVTGGQSTLLLLGFAALALYWLASLIPFLAVTARRFHDIGLSAWWMLLILTPLLVWIFMTVCCLLPGQKSANRFGDPVAI